MTEAERLMIAANRATGLMEGLGHNPPACADEAQQILRQTREALRDEAAHLGEAVELFENVKEG